VWLVSLSWVKDSLRALRGATWVLAVGESEEQ